MEEQVKNAIIDSCEECGKNVVYEKDEDSGLDSIEIEPFVWEQLCEDCAQKYYDRNTSA